MAGGEHGWRFAAAIALGCVLSGCPDTNDNMLGIDVVDVHRPRDVQSTGDSSVPDATIADATLDGHSGTDAMDVVIDAPPVLIHVRLGNVLPPNPSAHTPPPALDVCGRPSGQTAVPFIGPLLIANGISAGVAWNQVSAYIDLPPGQFDLVFVAAGATDCATPLLPLISDVDLSTPGSYSTLLVRGIPSPPDAGANPAPFGVSLLHDHDPATAARAPQPLLRLYDALVSPTPLPPLDVGLVTDPTMPATSFLPIFGNVVFGELSGAYTGMEAALDSLGYFQAAPLPMVTVGARIHQEPATPPQPPILVINNLMIVDHTFTTAIFTLGVGPSGIGAAALMCIDSLPAAGGYSVCQVVFPGP